MFEIDETPFPSSRIIAGKYNETFAQMRPGQCIKTEPKNVDKISASMRKWVKNRGRDDVLVSSVSKMDDGFGRVYMLPKKPLKMADIAGRKIKKMDWEAA